MAIPTAVAGIAPSKAVNPNDASQVLEAMMNSKIAPPAATTQAKMRSSPIPARSTASVRAVAATL